MPILELKNLTLRFGGLTAVNDVSFQVNEGEIYSVIGPNGAGKTTLFNAVTGIYEPSEGCVLFQGKDLSNRFSWRVAGVLFAVALFTAAFATVALHLELLWEISIVRNFRYGQSFPWQKALAEAVQFLVFQGRSTWPTFIVAAGLGGAGSFVVWKRQRRSPESIALRGICRTFQNIRLFRDMTVVENVLVGLDRHLRTRIWHMALRLPHYFRDEAAARKKALELIEFVGLGKQAGVLAKNLAYGDQRRLEIARAMATSPRLLLLDEPAAGMNPTESVELMHLIRRIREKSITVLLIEHHMRLVMDISDRIAVLNYGAKIAEGTPAEIRAHPAVIEAYLGEETIH